MSFHEPTSAIIEDVKVVKYVFLKCGEIEIAGIQNFLDTFMKARLERLVP